MSETYYKIRDKSTGLFSTGGYHPRWLKTGKVWKRKGALSNHFNLIQEYNPRRGSRDPYFDAEIVEYSVSEIGTSSIYDWTAQIRQRQITKEAQRQIRIERARVEERRRQYEELRREFESVKDVDGHD